MNKSVFRKVSLERLSSPDQIDQLLFITNPYAWISLIGISLILVFIVLWSVFGEITVKIEGKGMLIKSGGVLNIQHISDGVIQEIMIKPGDYIVKGQIIAKIKQIDIVNQYNEAEMKLRELNEKRDILINYNERNVELQEKYYEQEEKKILENIQQNREKLKFKEEYLRKLNILEKEGGVTKQQVFDSKQEYNAILQAILDGETRLKQLIIKKNENEKSQGSEEIALINSINEVKRKISKLQEELKSASNVVSPYSGTIIEVMVNEGGILLQGNSIASIEPVNKYKRSDDIKAIIFIPIAEGNNIKVGMEVFISPSVVKKEEYGYIMGKVNSVSSYPATFQGMMKILGNETMVKNLSEDGPVTALKVDLINSGRNPSGYKWSSKKGPNVKITGGAICSGYVTVEKKRPISLVLPALKKSFY